MKLDNRLSFKIIDFIIDNFPNLLLIEGTYLE